MSFSWSPSLTGTLLMILLKRRVALLCLMLAALIVAGCNPSVYNPAQQRVGASGKQLLRVGISTNSPPLAYKQGSNIIGLEADFARQLAAYLDRELVFVEMSWDKQLPALESGKTDIIMSGMTITPKREYRVAFANPYMRSGQMLLFKATNRRQFSAGLFSLMGDSPVIGVIEGTTGDYFITETINRPRLIRFPTSAKAVKALIDGEIEVFVHDTPIICHYAAINEKAHLTPLLEMITEEYLGWAVNRGNPLLLEKVNAFVDENRKSGRLQATITRWIPYM